MPRAKLKPSKHVPLPPLDSAAFARDLMAWYMAHARTLPWRGIRDPYRTWLSEIMLQQTRVNAVIEHYERFLRRFPTMLALALAPLDDVLAHWSGLGYYRRARMLHRAAQLLVQEHDGTLPSTAAELQRLPGIGAYTSAAIASIAFGERIAVVDGNVERVLLRVLGLPEKLSKQSEELLNRVAQTLVPERNAGDHNQAMMELGATVCLPRGPLCDVCPVYAYCRTRGEHETVPRARMRSERVAYALVTRKVSGSVAVEILLQQRPANVSLMAGMLELPQLHASGEGDAASDDLVLTESPVLRVRHAIVGTNYYVEVFPLSSQEAVLQRALRPDGLEWVPAASLPDRPLTGLARKVLQRTRLMRAPVATRTSELPLLIGRGGRAATGEDA